MYRELLSDLIRKVKWAQLQDPCSEQDLEAAEKVVGYPFPDELKDLLRETNGDRWFLLSAKEIIENVERNRAILSECFDPEEFLEKVDRHIFFATNGCGDYYCYKVSANGEVDTSGIYLWGHEDFETRYVAKDIKDAIIKYYNDEI